MKMRYSVALTVLVYAMILSSRPALAQFSQQGPKLVGTGGVSTSEQQQGYSVALSGDGNTAIVGGPGYTFLPGTFFDLSDDGAAWVWTRSGGVWTQQGTKLFGSGSGGSGATGTGSGQGYSVALSADGNTAIVGGPYDNNEAGAAWIWTRSGNVWTQQGAKLVASDASAFAEQGTSVALSADGNTAIVGGTFDNYDDGAAWVWTRSGGVWTQQGSKLFGSDSSGAWQGYSVALSADGNTAIVGGPGSWDESPDGGAWVWTRSGGVWTQQGSKLVGPYGTGAAVSLSADGNTAIVGAPFDTASGPQGNSIIEPGAALVWTRSGGVWTQQGPKLVGSYPVEQGSALQGSSVCLSADGNAAVVGGPGLNAAWVWTRSGGVWTPNGTKLVGSGAGPGGGGGGSVNQGFSVSLSGDASTAIVGGPHDNIDVGAAWVFSASPATSTAPTIIAQPSNQSVTAGSNATFTVVAGGTPAPTLQWQLSTNAGATWTGLTNASPYSGVTTSTLTVGSVPSSLNGTQFRCMATNSIGSVTTTAATLTVTIGAGGSFSQQGSKLVGTGAVGPAVQGRSMSLSGDGNTLIVGGDGDNGNAGAAWVWTRSGGTWAQQGTKLTGSGAVGNAIQGSSVSLSGDGNTAIVGGPFDSSGAGTAWVWTRSGGVWNQQGTKLVGSGAVGNAQQGRSVSLSADGNTAIVGAIVDNGVGAAWIWTRSGGVWTQQGAKLVGSGAVGNAQQGWSVSLSADGNTAVVGGRSDTTNAGAAWVWTRSGGIWTQQGAKLVGSGAEGNAHQGDSVSLSADGNTAIVGGSSNGGTSSTGAAWVWTRSGGVWTQQGSKLVGSGAVGNAQQGSAVSLSADGNTAVVGGEGNNGNAGAAWVWTRSAGVWTQQVTKLVGLGAVGNAYQGWSVSISADGNTASLGGPFDNGNTGAAWVFAVPVSTSTPPIVTSTPANSVAQTSATLNGTINPNGKSTTGYFQWGLTSPSYGNTTTSQTMGSGTSAVGLSQGLTSLACNTLYHFRTVGTNSDGTTNGSDLTFTTSSCPATAPTVSEVSPASGTTAGGTQVTVSGTGFIAGASVTFGGAAATSVSVTSSSTITCNTPAHSAGGVTVQVTNPNSQSGQLSSAFTYTSATPTLPVITTEPSNQSVTAGANANFRVAASGTPTPTLQWQVSANAGATWANLTNASPYSFVTSSVLEISNVSISLNGEQFRCVATNSAGSVTSTAATLTVTVNVDSLFSQQGTRLVGTGAADPARQGISVSLSADGNTAIVGGNLDNPDQPIPDFYNNGSGAAWVWTRSGGVWTQQGTKLVGSGAVGNAGQGSVCLSADGNTAIVGGGNDNGGAGAAWVWTRSGAVWTQQGTKLVGSGAVGNASQGGSVSLSADGNTAIVGGGDDNGGAGAAWIWTRSGGVWTQQGTKLVGSGAVGNAGQRSVCLSADGNTAIVGGPEDNGFAGAAWVWSRSGGVWTQQGTKLVGSGAVGNAWQGSVSLSADGNTAIVGGFEDNDGAGAVWVWTRSGGVWTKQGTKLVGSGASVDGAGQGSSVSLSADGNRAIVGGPYDNIGAGAAWVWTRNGGVWTQRGTKIVGSGADAQSLQGDSVSLSADGNTAIVGGPGQNPGAGPGAAWIFAAGANAAVPPRRRAVGH